MIKNGWRRLRNSKWLQSIPRWLKIALLLLLAWWLLQVFNVLPSFREMFRAQPVVIEDTPILIKEIKSIAQLISIESYDEVVADSVKPLRKEDIEQSVIARAINLPLMPSVQKIVLIGKGKVVAGTNLQQLHDSSFYIKKDSISLTLPKAVILDVIINPSGFETFSESGNWRDAEVRLVKEKVLRKMKERALARGILGKADARARLVIENFLRSAGFRKVTVR
jgi:hypothetical protein